MAEGAVTFTAELALVGLICDADSPRWHSYPRCSAVLFAYHTQRCFMRPAVAAAEIDATSSPGSDDVPSGTILNRTVCPRRIHFVLIPIFENLGGSMRPSSLSESLRYWMHTVTVLQVSGSLVGKCCPICLSPFNIGEVITQVKFKNSSLTFHRGTFPTI